MFGRVHDALLSAIYFETRIDSWQGETGGTSLWAVAYNQLA